METETETDTDTETETQTQAQPAATGQPKGVSGDRLKTESAAGEAIEELRLLVPSPAGLERLLEIAAHAADKRRRPAIQMLGYHRSWLASAGLLYDGGALHPSVLEDRGRPWIQRGTPRLQTGELLLQSGPPLLQVRLLGCCPGPSSASSPAACGLQQRRGI